MSEPKRSWTNDPCFRGDAKKARAVWDFAEQRCAENRRRIAEEARKAK